MTDDVILVVVVRDMTWAYLPAAQDPTGVLTHPDRIRDALRGSHGPFLSTGMKSI